MEWCGSRLCRSDCSRTEIFPFYGGDALTTFEGDQMIRPDSEIKVVDAATVEAVCYDGKSRTVALK